MMHDMAITEDYAILLDVPLVFRPEVMVTKNRLPLVYDKSRPARFGIIPKRPKSGKEVRWFDLDPGERIVVTHCHRTSRCLPLSCFPPAVLGHAWGASLTSFGIIPECLPPPKSNKKARSCKLTFFPSALHGSGEPRPSTIL